MNGFSGGGLRALLDDPNFITSLSEQNNAIISGPKPADGMKYKLCEPMFDASAALLSGGTGDIWSGFGFGTEGSDFLECMDLDEFLTESGLGSLEELPNASQHSVSRSPEQEAPKPVFLGAYSAEVGPVDIKLVNNQKSASPLPNDEEPESPNDDSDIKVAPKKPPINIVKKRTYDKDGEGLDEASVIVVPGQEGFDPVTSKFKPEELLPQPIIKKSRKIFVPEGSKDEKYWKRRNKNNVAAKRSREARRAKENQIIMRASFLEDENERLTSENWQLLDENKRLQAIVKKQGLVA